MNSQLIFWAALLILTAAVVIFDIKYAMLKDMSDAERKPHSFARVQLAWWSVIILASFIAIMAEKGIPTLGTSTLILLGISAGTTAAARIIDLSDIANPKISMCQNENAQNFVLDILSDEKGVSIHRFQTVVFNLAFGVWFVVEVLRNLADKAVIADAVMPQITPNNLILLGLSAGTYAALKATENKPSEAHPESVPDEALSSSTKAEG